MAPYEIRRAGLLVLVGLASVCCGITTTIEEGGDLGDRLAVSGGSGTGRYARGSPITIGAASRPEGFSHWELSGHGDVDSWVADPLQESTTILIPATLGGGALDITATAIYLHTPSSTELPSPSSREASVDDFVWGERGVRACPEGSSPIRTVAGCAAASGVVGLRFDATREVCKTGEPCVCNARGCGHPENPRDRCANTRFTWGNISGQARLLCARDPTEMPTGMPTDMPTESPTPSPTAEPTAAPTSNWVLLSDTHGCEPGNGNSVNGRNRKNLRYCREACERNPNCMAFNLMNGYYCQQLRHCNGGATKRPNGWIPKQRPSKWVAAWKWTGPTPEPTELPTPSPTDLPTESPTESPTQAPTDLPTPSSTELPSPMFRRKEASVDDYVWGEHGVGDCPEGSSPIRTVAECEAASGVVGLRFDATREVCKPGESCVCNARGCGRPENPRERCANTRFTWGNIGGQARLLCARDRDSGGLKPPTPEPTRDGECTEASPCDLGGNGCGPYRPCYEFQGDCDSDEDCAGYLVCVPDAETGMLSGGGYTDFCRRPDWDSCKPEHLGCYGADHMYPLMYHHVGMFVGLKTCHEECHQGNYEFFTWGIACWCGNDNEADWLERRGLRLADSECPQEGVDLHEWPTGDDNDSNYSIYKTGC